MTDTPPAVPPTTRLVELPYHRLYRANPTYRWWRPLVAVALTGAFFLGVNLILSIALLVVLFTTGTLTLENATDTAAVTELLLPDMARPWTIAFGLAAIALVLPLIPLALRIAGIRPAGVRVNVLHSVLFRLRGGWLLHALLCSVVVWVGITAVQLALGFAAGDELGEFTIDPLTYAISLVLVLLLVPIQAATEEYLFRGVLLQSVGAWFAPAVVAIVLSSAAFAFSHAYDAWGIVQVALMGIGFAFVTIRTGGLEAAIAFHIVNNIGAFAIMGLGVFSGGETGMTVETGGPVAALAQLITVVVWVLVIEWRFRVRKVERLSRIEVPDTGMPPAPVR